MEYGCIGEVLKHSFSKEIHALFADYKYTIKEIPKGDLSEFMTRRDFRAINVTIPYKRDVIPYLDSVSDKAQQIGAVNTIVNKEGKLFGFNTDFFGMTALIKRAGIEISGKKVLILGSGGTSSTANAVVKALGASSVYTISRSSGNGLITYEEVYKSHTDADILINTTPVGMYPNIDGMPVDIDKFASLSGVVDAVYNPLRTRLVRAAQSRNIKATGGLYMLVAQAAAAVEKFIDAEISEQKIEEVYAKIAASKENIVLIGMPACGKSTIGAALANKLQREFIDTDEKIVETAGKPITEIFASVGEQGFRKIETEVISSLASLSGKVIATGGGAILNPHNVEALRLNGRLYFIDRPLEWLTATSDRPLSSNRADLEKRYTERYGKYSASANKVIKPTEDVSKNVELILSDFINYKDR